MKITKDQAVDNFLEHIRALIWYYEREDRLPTSKEKLEGLAFSILVAFDGESDMPGMDIVMRPHPDDKDFRIEYGEDWYEDGMVINSDIEMHERWHKK